MNDQEERERLMRFFVKSKLRMARMITEGDAPDAIIANEALILLRTYYGGCWRAIGYWTCKEICRLASNVCFDAQVAFHAAWIFLWDGLPAEEAMQLATDRIILRIEPAALCTHEFAKTRGGGMIQCCQCGRNFTLEEYEAQKGGTA